MAPGRALAQQQTTRDDVAGFLSGISYGIPTSPAFALLPDQPTEVQHIETPADFQSAVTSWLDGKRLRTGAALDFRPFSSVGSLRQYQRDPTRQVLFRTVLSAGTAPAEMGSQDVLISLGARIPIIDRADLRADAEALDRLEEAENQALLSIPRPPGELTAAQLQQRADSVSKMTQPVRDSIAQAHWNRFKWDLGAALAARAHNGEIEQDSVFGDRGGAWTSVAVPVSGAIQATGTAKLTWARADTVGGETSRQVLGARVRIFPNRGIALSAEAAHVWASFRERNDLDEDWSHVAGVLEFPTSFLGGWIRNGWVSLAYGGDLSRRGDPSPKFSLQYALYQNRILRR
jgi:hypothetical protein